VGIVATEEALRMAKEAGLDLVEVAPNAKPSVCRIMDFNKLQYEKRRKAKESRKKAKQIHLKEIKFRPTINSHDFETKVKQARGFLSRGDKVKVSLMFRGRQVIHPELGEKILKQLIEAVTDVGQLESSILKQGRFIMAFLVGKAPVAAPKQSAKPENPPSENPPPENPQPENPSPENPPAQNV